MSDKKRPEFAMDYMTTAHLKKSLTTVHLQQALKQPQPSGNGQQSNQTAPAKPSSKPDK